MSKLIGSRRPRREDPPLLTGEARYAGDHAPSGLAHLVVVRSPFPHGRLRSIGLDAIRGHAGVLGAWSASDFPDLGTLPGFPVGTAQLRERPVLPAIEVRYAGEAVAMVIADAPERAADAAAAVEVDVEPLTATADPMLGEVATTLERGFGDIDAAFADSPVIVSARLKLARVTGGYMEPRATTAALEGDILTVHTSTQWVHGVRDAIAKCLALPTDRVRVLAPHVGGAFGAKGFAVAEEILTAAAALRLRRPVRWIAARSEDMLAGTQSHGTVLDLELAADRDGRLRGVRGRIWHPIGAYAAAGPGQVDNIVSHLLSAYRLPALRVTVDLVYTNTAPSGFIRGGGREVGNFAIERLVDRLARDLRIDPVELRRRNLVPPSAMPFETGYRTPRITAIFDGGDYPAMLDQAWAAVGGDAFRAGRHEGPAQGLGVACFTESTGIGEPEHARVAMDVTGNVTLYIGTTPQGQGHETAAAQVAGEHLGWPAEMITVVAGDSAAVPTGRNTSASRSAVEMGSAVGLAADSARRKLLALAAEQLEVAAEDLELGPGGANVRGVPDRRVRLDELIPNGLEVAEVYDPERRRAYAAGCAAIVAEVDVETGAVQVRRHVFVHDVGRQINPLVVEGQVHGGAAHGLGYALFEEFAYDEGAAPRTSGFLDYSIVSAGEVVEPETSDIDTPSPSNPGGFRGAGEGATVPVAAAVAAAVEDALRSRGLDVFITELPISPDRLHRLITQAASHKQEATR
ncbi:MAG TPA: xanthine dehydrogenase family protein molybdopterin-binding subunit [Candidatus Dormibacteraeota bacterium]